MKRESKLDGLEVKGAALVHLEEWHDIKLLASFAAGGSEAVAGGSEGVDKGSEGGLSIPEGSWLEGIGADVDLVHEDIVEDGEVIDLGLCSGFGGPLLHHELSLEDVQTVAAVVVAALGRDTPGTLLAGLGKGDQSSSLAFDADTTIFLALLLLHFLAGAVLAVEGIAEVLSGGSANRVFFHIRPASLAGFSDKVTSLTNTRHEAGDNLGLASLVLGSGISVHFFVDQLRISQVTRVLAVLLTSANDDKVDIRNKIFREEGNGAGGKRRHDEKVVGG